MDKKDYFVRHKNRHKKIQNFEFVHNFTDGNVCTWSQVKMYQLWSFGLDRCSTFNKVIGCLTLHLQSGDCCIFLEPLVQKLKLLYICFNAF